MGLGGVEQSGRKVGISGVSRVTGLLRLLRKIGKDMELMCRVVWGGATMFILYVLSVNVYRPTSHRASRQRISEGWDQASKRTRELRLKARQAKNTTMDAGKRGVQRAKEMRHEMTPQGRAEARRRRE